MTWINADGLRVDFASVNKSDTVHPEKTSEMGPIQSVEVAFSYDDLPTFTADNDGGGTNDIFTGMDTCIPAGAEIVEAILEVGAAWSTGTSLTIGLYNQGSKAADSTAIDADGIDNAILTAALTAGARIECDGALVRGGSIGSSSGYIVATTAGSYDAGDAVLTVKYRMP